MTIASLKRPWKCAAAGSGLMAMLVALVVSAGFIKEGCADTASMPTAASLPAVVTSDIQAGIERHIEEQVLWAAVTIACSSRIANSGSNWCGFIPSILRTSVRIAFCLCGSGGH